LSPSALTGRAALSEVADVRTIPLRRFAAGPRGADLPDGARPCGFSLSGSDAAKLEAADGRVFSSRVRAQQLDGLVGAKLGG
jgi:hypothetical protein